MNGGTETTRRAPSQCDRILDVLADRQKHTVTEIHQTVGPCRLNSRVAELRNRLRTEGLTIVCEHIAGETGPGSYLYAVVPLDETKQAGQIGSLVSSSGAGSSSGTDGNQSTPPGERPPAPLPLQLELVPA